MALTTFALGNLLFSFTARDERETMFTLDTFSDRRFLLMTGLSSVAILIGTAARHDEPADPDGSLSNSEWLICILVALTIIPVSEAFKWYLRRGVA